MQICSNGRMKSVVVYCLKNSVLQGNRISQFSWGLGVDIQINMHVIFSKGSIQCKSKASTYSFENLHFQENPQP